MNAFQLFQKENIFGNKFILLTICITLFLVNCSDNSTEPENIIERISTPQDIVWEQTSLTNERIFSIVFNSSGDIFAGSLGNGKQGVVFRSKDDGDTWMKSELNSGIISELAINSKGHIFAATGSGGILRSTDNGDSWTRQTREGRVRTIAINSDDHIFVGDNGGIVRSTDNGDSFTLICVDDDLYHVDRLAINSMGHIFAATQTENGFFRRSTDNGETCPAIDFIYAYTLATNSSDDIFVGLGSVHRSTDNGDTWTEVGMMGRFVQSLAINSKDNEIFAGAINYYAYYDSNGGVFRSNDNGDSWTEIVSGLTSTSVLSIGVNPSGRLFAGVDSLGIFRSKE